MAEIKELKNLLRLLVAIVFVSLSIISWSTIVTVRTSASAEKLSKDNNRFLDNFSNYMNCLVVNEDEVVIAVGEEAYVEICKQLLYRGIPDIPPTIKATIPDPNTTTTTTEG